MDCDATFICVFCTIDPLVADRGPASTEILNAVLEADAAGLRDVLETYGDKLLLHPSRGLLAVRGSSCNPDAITAAVFITTEKSDALLSFGVGELGEFLGLTGR